MINPGKHVSDEISSSLQKNHLGSTTICYKSFCEPTITLYWYASQSGIMMLHNFALQKSRKVMLLDCKQAEAYMDNLF